MNITIFCIWLLLIVLWNFGFPNALPILDVLAAIILSLLSKYLEKLI